MKFDVVIIGSGPGGYVAAVRSAKLGLSTAVVERDALGGICLNWGCIPTKTLLKSAQAYRYAQSGSSFGFYAENVVADLPAMVSRSREVAASMSRGIEYLFKKNGVSLIKGSGRLLSCDKVEVTDAQGEKSTVEASHIIVATGSSPASLPFAPIDGKKIISYRQALIPESVPESLAVIGSGAIGTELAFFYRSLGSEVTLIEYMDRILPVEDDDVCAQVSRCLRKMGIKVMTSSSVRKVDTASDKCVLEVETAKGTVTLEADRVLSAVGVKPNTGNLGLEELGIVTEKGRIPVDEYFRTGVTGVYAIGDVIPTPALAHVASAEAVCCVEKLAGLNPDPVDYSNIPGCTYISPEVASVGMTERKVKELGIDYKIGKFPFTASGKAAASGNRDGFVKLIIDSVSDQILGAHLVGENVSEMVGGLVAARKAHLTAKTILGTIFPHPTMSEAIMEAAADSHNESIHI